MNAVTWASVTFTYEFIHENAPALKGATLGLEIGPEKAQPNFRESKIRCDLQNVFKLVTTNAGIAPKIFWEDEVFGSNGNALLLLQKGAPRDIALIAIHENEAWLARSELTLDKRLAITVVSEANKLLFVGTGDVIEVDLKPMKPGLPPKKGHQVIVTLHEVYPWMSPNPGGCAHCAGSVRTTTPSATPDYSAPDGGACFAAGTPVVVADNMTKSIDKLRLGDFVLARDEKTGSICPRRIRHIYMHHVQSTLLMDLNNGEQIETTGRHHFAVAKKGFRAADDLESGSTLLTYNAKDVVVSGVEPRSAATIVYNLEVDEFHTYFVGKTGVWVHNMMKQDPAP